MNAVINSLKCPPSYLVLPEYVPISLDGSITFHKIMPYTKSVTISAIGAGGGGGCGGVHSTTATIGNSCPAGAGGGGSGNLVTVNKKIEDILKLVNEDGSGLFKSGYEYGFCIEVGTYGNGTGIAGNNGTDGGNSKVYIVRQKNSEIIKKEIMISEGGKGGYTGGSISTATTQIYGGNGGAGGHGGAGGRKGYRSGLTNLDGNQGSSYYANTEKPYLFGDSNTKIVLGQGGGGGEADGYATSPTGIAPAYGETAYGVGGKGGDSVGKDNHNANQPPLIGSNGTDGFVGIRMHYR